MRSIPVHAGEPCPLDDRGKLTEVYPRPRGGTSPFPIGRARGPRSIPVHAGEPVVVRATAPVDAVYPRPRGGTAGK